MGVKFVCGMVEVGEGAEPDWGEVAARLRLLQQLEKETAHFKFMGAVQDDYGAWRVPFLAALKAPSEMLKRAIEGVTPYDATKVVPLRVSRVPADRLSELSDLVEGQPASVKAADLAACRGQSSTAGDEKDAFSGLVGMEEQRLMLMKLGTAVAKHGRGAVDCLHLVFVGNPGTGKTELASRLVSYLDRVGVTDGTHRMVRVGGNDLMGEYTGQTAPRVKKFVESARGGMLFIDEFYSLSASANNYGREVVDTLTEQLDRYRDDLVCVIAGYPTEVAGTLELNPGLRERFGYRVEFPDYSIDQLAQIFCGMAGARGCDVACAEALPGVLETLSSSAGFSNARSVRRLVDHAVVEASWVRDEAVIEEADLECALPQCLDAPARRRAGF